MIKRIEIYKSTARKTRGQFGFRVKGRNNRIIAVAGELFKNKKHVERAVRHIFLMSFSPVADFYGKWTADAWAETLQVVDLTGKGGAR